MDRYWLLCADVALTMCMEARKSILACLAEEYYPKICIRIRTPSLIIKIHERDMSAQHSALQEKSSPCFNFVISNVVGCCQALLLGYSPRSQSRATSYRLGQ